MSADVAEQASTVELGNVTEQDWAHIRRRTSPRFAPPPTPWRSRAIHAAPMLLWVLLIVPAFVANGVAAWSAGLAYIAYDTLLLAFVFWQTLDLLRPTAASPPTGRLPSATVIVAAHNEAAVLGATIATLLGQSGPGDIVMLADDGSDDASATLLERQYGLLPGRIGEIGPTSPRYPTLRWLRLPRGGKARALNVACAIATTELVLTVDADTLLDPGALEAMRIAFAADPALVAATGLLTPTCGRSPLGRAFEWFQTYEYVRNFLSRYAWMRADGLLLISGAFACFRRQPLASVGGFDPDCLVEDYELIHRLRDHAGRHGLIWRTAVIGAARARTDAPGTAGAFLRQRRRWFGGFLQTQRWYRHMVGNPNYGRLGTMMLPVKAMDTLQPLYGLTGVALAALFLATGRFALFTPIAIVTFAKIALDLAFYLWSLTLCRRWTRGAWRLDWRWAALAALLEPFSFQLLRHVGAALGWVWFLRGARTWGVQTRVVATR